MKLFLNEYINHNHPHVPFTPLTDGMIESEGIILKRLSRRIRHKKIVLEYYKCFNTYSRTKNCGPCKFSGKLIYQVNSSHPTSLEIIKPHSLFCLNNEGNKLYLSPNATSKKRKKKIKIIPFEHEIYSDSVPIVNISVQIESD